MKKCWILIRKFEEKISYQGYYMIEAHRKLTFTSTTEKCMCFSKAIPYLSIFHLCLAIPYAIIILEVKLCVAKIYFFSHFSKC